MASLASSSHATFLLFLLVRLIKDVTLEFTSHSDSGFIIEGHVPGIGGLQRIYLGDEIVLSFSIQALA
jgi:hypothetical protein